LSGFDDFDFIYSSKFGKLKMSIIKYIDINIVLSTYIKHINIKYMPENKVALIPNGAIIKDYNIEEKEKYVFCCIGVISERKRTYEAISYFIDNYVEYKDTLLYVVGPDKGLLETDEQYVCKCKQFAKNNGRGKIIFTGKLSQHKTISIYKKSIALLFFSEKEGMPNTILEAMSYSCVPVSTPIQGVAYEIIDNEKNGFIIESLQTSISIEHIMSIMITENSRKKIQDNFSISKIAENYRDIYTKLRNNI
jgi:glycosyltransferase involved in cell wall biosynthesis